MAQFVQRTQYILLTSTAWTTVIEGYSDVLLCKTSHAEPMKHQRRESAGAEAGITGRSRRSGKTLQRLLGSLRSALTSCSLVKRQWSSFLRTRRTSQSPQKKGSPVGRRFSCYQIRQRLLDVNEPTGLSVNSGSRKLRFLPFPDEQTTFRSLTALRLRRSVLLHARFMFLTRNDSLATGLHQISDF